MAKTSKAINNNNNNVVNNKENKMNAMDLINAGYNVTINSDGSFTVNGKAAPAAAQKVSNRATEEDSWFRSLTLGVCEGIEWLAEKTVSKDGLVTKYGTEAELYIRNEAAHQVAGGTAYVLETADSWISSAASFLREKEKEWMPEVTVDEAQAAKIKALQARYAAEAAAILGQ